MPRLVSLYIRQVIIGFVLSAIFVAILLWTNVGGLLHLVTHVGGGGLAVLMLWVFNGIVFSGVQFAISVMRMADKPNASPPAGGRKLGMAPELVPARVRR